MLTAALSIAAVCATVQQDRVFGVVRDDGGNPIAGATVRYGALHPRGLPWLAQLERRSAEARTSERGTFRLDAADPGFLWVEHPSGSGALVTGVAPGALTQVVARPLGAIGVAGEREFTMHVFARGAVLGPIAGPTVRLPSGDYEVWLEAGGRSTCVSCTVVAGGTVELELDESRTVLAGLRRNQRVTVLPWLSNQLAPDPDGRVELPDDPRGLSVRVATSAARGTAFDDRPLLAIESRRHEWTAARPTWRAVTVRGDGEPIAGAIVATLRLVGGRVVPAARSRTDAGGRAHVRVIDGDSVAVIVADGWATEAVDTDADVIELAPEHTAAFRFVDDRGGAIEHARVTTGAAVGESQVRFTNSRGVVHFTGLRAGPWSVHIDHDAHLPLRTELAMTRGIPEVRLDPGLELHGVAMFEPGRAAAGITIEVRDTTGVLGLAPRTTTTDEHGAFVFRGLPDGLLTLFAQAEIDGVTWSAKQPGVQPGLDEWQLDLRSEDPPPPNKRKRGGH